MFQRPHKTKHNMSLTSWTLRKSGQNRGNLILDHFKLRGKKGKKFCPKTVWKLDSWSHHNLKVIKKIKWHCHSNKTNCETDMLEHFRIWLHFLGQMWRKGSIFYSTEIYLWCWTFLTLSRPKKNLLRFLPIFYHVLIAFHGFQNSWNFCDISFNFLLKVHIFKFLIFLLSQC